MNNNNDFNNSLAFNVQTDDLTYRGYMALAYAICGVKDCDGKWKKVGLKKIKSIFGLSQREVEADDLETNKTFKQTQEDIDDRKHKYVNIKLINIETNEVQIFKNTDELNKHFKDGGSFNSYISNNWIYKKKYKFESEINPNYVQGAKYTRRVKVTNVNNKEVVVYKSAKEAAENIGINISTVYIYIKNKITTKNGLKFEYIKG
ncbi:NUMOD1 domain [uncultured Clostridium sp.]|nr:NUMOD1 domain [uncultured Clostridium sp.]